MASSRDLEREELPEEQVTQQIAAAPAVRLLDRAIELRIVEVPQGLEWPPRFAFFLEKRQRVEATGSPSVRGQDAAPGVRPTGPS